MAELNISWPTQDTFASGFGTALGAASSGITVSPAIRDTVAVLGAVVESTTGKPLGEFVAGKSAELIASIAQEFAGGTLEISVQLSKQIGSMVGAVSSMIPMFAMAVEAGMAALGEAEEQRSERLGRMTQGGIQYCKGRYLMIDGTGIAGTITPADTFRPIYESIQLGTRPVGTHQEYRYPLTAASLFCALCGPVSPLGWNDDKRTSWTRGGGFGSAAGATMREYYEHRHGYGGYAKFLRNVRARLGPSDVELPSGELRPRTGKVGINYLVQKKMAALIRGIMGSVRPATFHSIEQVGDQGRTLFPILADLLLHEWRAGHWNEAYLRELQDSQIKCRMVLDYNTGVRVGPVVDLSVDFSSIICAWKNTIEVASATYTKSTRKARRIPFDFMRGRRKMQIKGAALNPMRRLAKPSPFPGPLVLGGAGLALVAAVLLLRESGAA